jgi:predicted metalloprotease with PDZ domain
MHAKLLIALSVSTALAAVALAQPAVRSAPHAMPVIDTVPAPRDTPWTAGTIRIEAEATDLVRRIIAVKQTIPVATAGPLTLLFPQWLPGHHAPTGEIEKMAGLRITANGEPVAWRRDPLNVHAFQLSVPQGVSELIVQFQFMAPTAPNQGRIILNDAVANIQWNSLSLYPAGYYARRIPVQATLTLPAGWTAASALQAEVSDDGQATRISYEETDYETLVDSPLFAGRHARSIDLGHDVTLSMVADDPAELAASPRQIDAHKRLVSEAIALFGSRHFDRYTILLAISPSLGGIQLEHHRSSENRVDPGYFGDWTQFPSRRYSVPHEFVHSWNGKFRMPELTWTPNYAVPTQNDMLWMYEGQTQFWGYVLSARSGIYSKQQTLDALASVAGRMDAATGRAWRPLVDTTYDPIISGRGPRPWAGWQRDEDYYNEGLMIWLEADAIMRQQSDGALGLDDFAKAFFGMNDGDWGQLTYSRQDLIEALNGVVPYDWAGFLRDRVDRPTAELTKAGFTLGGYRLVYGDTPNGYDRDREKELGIMDQSMGAGLTVDDKGLVRASAWESPAFKAGITVGGQITAVNGEDFSLARLRAGIGQSAQRPLSLIIKQDGRYRVITLDYSDGIRYPRLEKAGEGESSLDRLLTSRTTEPQVNQPHATGNS